MLPQIIRLQSTQVRRNRRPASRNYLAGNPCSCPAGSGEPPGNCWEGSDATSLNVRVAHTLLIEDRPTHCSLRSPRSSHGHDLFPALFSPCPQAVQGQSTVTERQESWPISGQAVVPDAAIQFPGVGHAYFSPRTRFVRGQFEEAFRPRTVRAPPKPTLNARSATRGVPCALIIWLARAVKVVRPSFPCDSTVDCPRFTMRGRLGRHARNLPVLF